MWLIFAAFSCVSVGLGHKRLSDLYYIASMSNMYYRYQLCLSIHKAALKKQLAPFKYEIQFTHQGDVFFGSGQENDLVDDTSSQTPC